MPLIRFGSSSSTKLSLTLSSRFRDIDVAGQQEALPPRNATGFLQFIVHGALPRLVPVAIEQE